MDIKPPAPSLSQWFLRVYPQDLGNPGCRPGVSAHEAGGPRNIYPTPHLAIFSSHRHREYAHCTGVWRTVPEFMHWYRGLYAGTGVCEWGPPYPAPSHRCPPRQWGRRQWDRCPPQCRCRCTDADVIGTDADAPMPIQCQCTVCTVYSVYNGTMAMHTHSVNVYSGSVLYIVQ